MTGNYYGTVAILVVSVIIGQSAIADERKQRSATDRLLDEINASVEAAISEVVDDTVEKAKTVVRENTGIDLRKRGYGNKRNHVPLLSGSGDEARRELRQLADEHDRKIRKLDEELDRKLAKSQDEFEREARKEEKVEKVREKRAKMKEKVDEAYAKFDKKVSEENRRFDGKRQKILDKEAARQSRRAGVENPHDGRQQSSAHAGVATNGANDTDLPRRGEEKSNWWEFWK